MRPNPLKRIWASGGAAINGWLAIPNSFSAEIMAQQGWDSLTLDLQHGLIDYGAIVPMLQAISTTGVAPLARVPWLEEGILMKMLDAGMLRSHLSDDQLEGRVRKVRACLPLSAARRTQLRSHPGAASTAARTTPRQANDEIVLLAMVETKASARRARRHPVGSRTRRHLRRPGRSFERARLHAEARPGRESRSGRRSTSSRARRASTGGSPASTTARRNMPCP